ncbi:OstA-like protein [Entomospira entomophila]|nr:OstA-like protein [Entomospira entomophilus]
MLSSYHENEMIQTWEIGSLIQEQSNLTLNNVIFNDIDSMSLEADYLQIFLEKKQWDGQNVHLKLKNNSEISIQSNFFTYNGLSKLALFTDQVLLINDSMHIRANSLEYNSLNDTMRLIDVGGSTS